MTKAISEAAKRSDGVTHDPRKKNAALMSRCDSASPEEALCAFHSDDEDARKAQQNAAVCEARIGRSDRLFIAREKFSLFLWRQRVKKGAQARSFDPFNDRAPPIENVTISRTPEIDARA